MDLLIRILTVVNNAAVNMWVHKYFQISMFVLLRFHPEVELLDHMIILWKIPILFYNDCTSLHSQQPCRRFPFLWITTSMVGLGFLQEPF